MNTLTNEIALNNTSKLDTKVAVADNGLLGSIFGLFTNRSAHEFLEHTGHYFLFPLAAIASLVRSGLAIRQAYLDKKRGSMVHAAVETVSALAITTAVVGGIAAASVFVLAAPIIFTTVLGAKTLFHAASSIYNLGKAAVVKSSDKPTYLMRAKMHAFGALTSAVITASVAMVFIAAKPVYAIMGIVGSVMGVAMGVFRGFKQYKESKRLKLALAEQTASLLSDENGVSSSYRIASQLGNNNRIDVTAQQRIASNTVAYKGGRLFDNRSAAIPIATHVTEAKHIYFSAPY